MGIVIGISGELCSSETLTLSQVNDIESILDKFDAQAFVAGSDIVEFSWDENESMSPLELVSEPLDKLMEYASKNAITFNGYLSLWSSCSDYDHITIKVDANKVQMKNSELLNASTEELVDELKSRDKKEVIKALKNAGILE